jgi:mRNA-degrading endonuclease RelE of RelBE toxin-antitoxin system
VNEKIYTIFLTQPAKNFLKKIDMISRKRLVSAIELIKEKPYEGKVLKGPFKNKLSWRVGKYRIIYQIRENKLYIFIVTIDLRKKAYK